MEGRIKTFLPSKGYGYIQGNDSKSYFFHIQDMTRQVTAIDDGQFVSFEESATPKGYRARNVEILDGQTYYLQPASKFFRSREGAPKGTEIVYSEVIHVHDKDLDIAKSELEQTARRYGFNGVIGVTYSKDTESSGNYKYSVHHFMGECVLLCRRVFTKDRELAERRNREFNETLHQIQSAYQAKLDAEARKRARKRLILCILAGGAIAFITSNVIQALFAAPK